MEKRKNRLFLAATIGIILLYISYSMMGFRWASTYVRTNHIITWKYGFIPRTFINEIAYFFLRDKLYSQVVLNLLILGVAAIFIVYIVASVIETVAVKKNVLCLLVFLMFSFSPYAKYYLHEAGYYEQYGYLLGIVLIEISRRKNWKITSVFSCLFAVISVLTSETNLFLIIPLLFIIAFLEIINENENVIKRGAMLFLGFLPSVIYSLLAFLIRVPKERMEQMYRWNLLQADFPLREDVYEYFWNDRSNADTWGRALHEIPIPCVIYPLLLIAVISFILYRKNKKMAVAFGILCILCGLANYSIVIVAWDLDRYYFCIYMQIFLVTIYVLKKHLMDYRFVKNDGLLFLIFLLGSLGMSGFEFTLFDDRSYLRSVKDVVQELQKAFR